MAVSNAVAAADAHMDSASRTPTHLREPPSSTQHAESNIATLTSTAQLLPDSADKYRALDRNPNTSDTGSGPAPGPSPGPEAQAAAPEEWVSGVPLLLVNAGVTLVIFLMLLDTSIVSTVGSSVLFCAGLLLTRAQAIPRITNQFHSLDDVAWYGSAYTLARYGVFVTPLGHPRADLDSSCALQPLTGKFYTYFKSKVRTLSYPPLPLPNSIRHSALAAH
jgi:hypothetical protein